jgi:hypothetical protein
VGKACPTPVVKKSRNLSKKSENQKNIKVEGKKSDYEGVEKAGNGRTADGRVVNFFIKSSANEGETLQKNRKRLCKEHGNIIPSKLSSLSRTKLVTLYGSADKVKEYVRMHSTGVRKILSIGKARVLIERNAKYSESARIWINASVTCIVTVTVVTIFCLHKEFIVFKNLKTMAHPLQIKKKAEREYGVFGAGYRAGQKTATGKELFNHAKWRGLTF